MVVFLCNWKVFSFVYLFFFYTQAQPPRNRSNARTTSASIPITYPATNIGNATTTWRSWRLAAMGSRSTRAIASSSPRIAIICTTWIAGIGRSSSRRSARRIVRVCTVFSRTKRNATCSGTVGTERHPSISAVLGSLTTVRRESVCGPIKYLNAKTRVRIAFRIVKCNFNFTYSKVTGNEM